MELSNIDINTLGFSCGLMKHVIPTHAADYKPIVFSFTLAEASKATINSMYYMLFILGWQTTMHIRLRQHNEIDHSEPFQVF